MLLKQVSKNPHRFPIHWLILGLALLALGGAIGYSITHEYNRIDVLERERLATQAKIVDANLEHQLIALNSALRSIRDDLPYLKAQKDSKALMNHHLQAMSDAMPGIRTINTTDAEGTVSASNRKQLIGLNFHEREYFRAARQGLNPAMLYISPPFKSVLGVYVMNVTIVVLDTRGAFAGIVSVTLDPDYFSVLLNSVLYAPGMRASLIHGDGKIFVEVPDRKDLSGMDLAKPGSRYTLHVKSGQTANLFATGRAYSTGDERMSAWRTIRPASLLMDRPLMITVNRDMRGIFATWHRGAFLQGGLFGVLFLAAVLGLYFYHRRQQKFDRLAANYSTELRESEERYRSLVELSPEAVVVHSEGKIEYINKSGVKIFGASDSGEIIGKSIKDFVHPNEWKKVEDRVRQVQEKNEPAQPQELVFNRLNGEAINVETAGVPITLSGKIASLTVIHDITERKRMEGEERRNREEAERLSTETAVIAEIGRLISSTLHIDEVYERFAAETQKLIPIDSLAVNLYNFQENTLHVVYVSGLNIDGRRQGDPLILEGSLSEAVIRARTSISIQPESFDEIAGQFPKLSPIFQAGLRSIMCVPLVYRGEVIGVLHFRAKKQNAYTEKDLRLAERIGVQIAGAIANAQLYADLKKKEQELKESEQRYRELSIVDDLTQLYNSRNFYFQLKIELDRSNRYEQPLTLLLLDIDNFKHFNDTYGHVEGDQVLQRLGQVVKRCLRETDFAYRYGGEEFTVILPMTTSVAGAITAERIRTEFQKETFFPVLGQEVHKTMSIGLAQYRPQEEMKAFVHRVDQLMYQGKMNGKDRVCSES